ncbi:CBS domain-containing protein [Streptomyces rimosus]|uniref:CBS domain-containing protein n=1 Tax=Streptomyces rimosus TaxID=1927 RepID=UPI001F32CF70|nr:CBS domain-containing protein [Streptomyces rimosus]
MQTRPAGAGPTHRKAVEAMDAAGPQVWDDMSVEVALSVMAAARTGRLVVCDQDSQYTALVTQRELTAVRNSSAYTDRVRLRDVLGVTRRSPHRDHDGRSRARDVHRSAR